MVINQTSIIGRRLTLDSLRKLGINVKLIFGPEHGFRGNASNGAEVSDEVDPKTGIKVVSLYGKKRIPSKSDMAAVDIVVFDIQDIGCRFFTVINTLCNVMTACAENNKELMILDRPNPNAYIDGPVLDMKLKSGIGQFPVPITHGMTIGEFAMMINGEGWLPNKLQCKIRIIPVRNYNHNMVYKLPINVSPNLNSQQAVLLYPSLCLFEGTVISQGRGTNDPFTVLGCPAFKGLFKFSFTPVSIPGKSETPLYQNMLCYGLNLKDYDAKKLHDTGKLNLSWMIDLYKSYPSKESFFDSSISSQIGHIDKLAGTKLFKEQIISFSSETEIRNSWEPGLSEYKKMHLKYLIYH